MENMYFVGRNYIDHAKELNNKIPEKPLIFCKPLSTFSKDNAVYLPEYSNEVHFEGEMVFQYGEEGYFVSCGIDYTARDIQSDIKAKGWPWFEAKCFKGSTVLNTDFVEISKDKLDLLSIKTFVNGEEKQHGFYKDTIFKIDFLFDYLNKIVPLKKGDIVFTGTPAGVGQVLPGDEVKVCLFLENKIISEIKSEVREWR